MCLAVVSGPHVALRAIPVFKILFEDNKSDHACFLYESNKEYTQLFPLTPKGGMINEGYHAYRYEAVIGISRDPATP